MSIIPKSEISIHENPLGNILQDPIQIAVYCNNINDGLRILLEKEYKLDIKSYYRKNKINSLKIL